MDPVLKWGLSLLEGGGENAGCPVEERIYLLLTDPFFFSFLSFFFFTLPLLNK